MARSTDRRQETHDGCAEIRLSGGAQLPSPDDELVFQGAVNHKPDRVTARAVWNSCLRWDAFKLEATMSQDEVRANPGAPGCAEPATATVAKKNEA